MKQILVATDFSEGADEAVRVANRFARAYGARVILMHAYDPFGPAMDYPALVWTGADLWTQLHAESVKLLSATRQRLLEDVPQVEELVVANASPASAICETAEERNVDLIMTSTHGRTGVSRLVLGSVAERVVRHAKSPVLAVRPSGTPDVFPSRILVTTDFSAASKVALQDAAELSVRFNARVTLAHVVDTPTALAMQRANRDLEVELRTVLTDLYREHFNQVVDIELLTGRSPAHVIVEHAGEKGYDLLVLATHGRTGLQHLVIGSIAEKVLRLSPCSVWTSRSSLPTPETLTRGRGAKAARGHSRALHRVPPEPSTPDKAQDG